MIWELPRSQFERARPLFQGPHLELVADAVVAGNARARIWVDDSRRPRRAFLWDRAHCYYLAGDPENDRFNSNVEELMAQEVVPEAMKRGLLIYKVHYTQDGGLDKVQRIFRDESLAEIPRSFYVFEAPRNADWRGKTPSGYRLQRINEALLRSANLRGADGLIHEIESCWYSLDDFLKNGFGYTLVNEDEITCRCTAEYVSPGNCGIGVQTAEEYRRRGFATLTASAFVDYCVSHGMIPHWDSWTANLPSIAVARKVGFRRLLDYSACLGRFGEAG